MTAARAAAALWDCRACLRELRAASRPVWCPSCGRTNTYPLDGRPPPPAFTRKRPIVEGATTPENDDETAPEAPRGGSWAWGDTIEPERVHRAASDLAPWRRVTGECARQHLTLLDGPTGAGKSRLVLQLAGGFVRSSRRAVVYQAAELRRDAVVSMAHGCGVRDELSSIAIVETRELGELAAVVRRVRPVAFVVDPISVAELDGAQCVSGSRAEREAAWMLVDLAREVDAAAIALLHMQASGEHASVGKGLTQHADQWFRLEKIEPDNVGPRVRLSTRKNRYADGPEDVDEIMRRTSQGFREIRR